jgi:hypothetical protein
MITRRIFTAVLFLLFLSLGLYFTIASQDFDPVNIDNDRMTRVSIAGDEFYINDRPVYEGRKWNGHKIQGLLMNSRMVQGIFDDVNPETTGNWVYPDTGEWDPDRNTSEFIAAMAEWRDHGVLSFTLNLQGGCPYGYCQEQPWINSAFREDGSLRPAFMQRLGRILDRADELGMVPIIGYFYFGQDERLEDEVAVTRAVDNATEWILDQGYENVIIEVNNECDIQYDHEILRCGRVAELIERVQNITRDDRRLYAGTSLAGGRIPGSDIIGTSDFVLLHGNGVNNPDRIAEMVRDVRKDSAWSAKPILFNEDDHYEFDREWNNSVAAFSEYASWGYFAYREPDGPYEAGYQSVPVDWGISTDQKREFFQFIKEVTGY